MKIRLLPLATLLALSLVSARGQSGTTVTDTAIAHLKLQIQPTGSTTPLLELRNSGTFFSTGANSTAFNLADLVAYAPVFLWDSNKMALKVGSLNSTSVSSIGQNSVSLGGGTASGYSSFAQGYGTASNYGSVILGSGSSTGYYSFVGGMGGASGMGAVALGYYVSSNGMGSTSLGYNTNTTADYSLAANYRSTATALYATALGNNSQANSQSSLAIGAFNASVWTYTNDGNNTNDGDTAWIPGDSLFEIGNGTASNARQNSLTAFKNGNLRVSGRIEAVAGLRTPPMGDISMGPYTTTATPAVDTNPASLNPTRGLRYSNE